jgi:fumarate reductase flavoprotein subunit
MTGTVLEEGLRGAGGYLLNGDKERFMQRYDARGERATRDIVSRGIYAEMRAGRTTPNGGVYIQMHHLGVDEVRKQFKGMVERCADCGFDLAGGLVEVVPTAHYMMGGVVFEPDCRTALRGLFAAGEDTGGVHGANRLGGNGVANSTVFGGIAGDSMAQWVEREGEWRAPDEQAIAAAVDDALAPFALPADGLNPIREALFECMWTDVGIMRDEAGLLRARGTLDELRLCLSRTGVAGDERAFNPTWHDWLNLRSLIAVSQVITEAALAREDSRGAHFREDFPQTGDLDTSAYTVVRWENGRACIDREAVRFTRVAPGQSLLKDAA